MRWPPGGAHRRADLRPCSAGCNQPRGPAPGGSVAHPSTPVRRGATVERTVTRLRPRFLLGLVAAALAVLVAPAASASAGLGTPGAAPTASADDEQTLADRYAPVVRLVRQAESCGPG